VEDEHLQLNEHTLYSGEPYQHFTQPDITKNFDQVIYLLRTGKKISGRPDHIQLHLVKTAIKNERYL
jgi:hypothetical protein